MNEYEVRALINKII